MMFTYPSPRRSRNRLCARLVCTIALTSLIHGAKAQLSTAEPPKYDAPITITKGGNYSGNWKSDDDDTPAVTIRTTEPVVIENSHLAGGGADLISAPPKVMNLTVRNCSFHGKEPQSRSRERGSGINANAYIHIVVENNFFDHTGIPIKADEYSGNGSDENTLHIRYNRVRNIDGRRADGTKQIVQFVAIQNYRQEIGNPRNADISWNEVINEPGKSCSEDLINFYLAGGRPEGWFKVHDNYLQGSYSPNPWKGEASGSGMIVDGPDHDKAAYIEAYNNIVINTTNAGMNIAAGSHIWYHHNRIISSGKFPDGAWIPGSFAGVGIFDYYAKDADHKGTMRDIVVENNVVGWAKEGYNNPYSNRQDNAANLNGAYKTSNVSLPDAPITQAMQDREYQTFLQRAKDAKIIIGPHTGTSHTP